MLGLKKKLPSGKLTWKWKIPLFPSKYHQNGGFSMAMLVYRRVRKKPFYCSLQPHPHGFEILPFSGFFDLYFQLYDTSRAVNIIYIHIYI